MIKVTPKRISELTLGETLAGTEEFAMVQSNETRRIVLTTLRDYFDSSCQCTLVSRSNQVCTGANNLEKYFESYTLPGGTLANDGDWLEIFASFNFGPNANQKNISFNFGVVTDTFTTTDTSGDDTSGVIQVKLQRVSSSIQKYSINRAVPNITGTALWDVEPATENLLSDVVISFSGSNTTSQAEDICLEQFIIVLHKLDPDS